MVRTNTLDPTPDAPRSYNLPAIRLLIKDFAVNNSDGYRSYAVRHYVAGTKGYLSPEAAAQVVGNCDPEVWDENESKSMVTSR